MTTSPRGGQTGARSLGDPPRKKRGWLWALLGLLALAIVAAVLIAALSGGDDDDDSAAGTATDSAQTQTTDGTSASGGAAAGEGGTLTADGESLLPVPADLSSRVGQQGVGQDVVVQEVSGQQGFWVGRSRADRVYVEYGAEVGGSEGGAEFKPTVGQRVDVTGPIRPTPEDPRQTLKVTDSADVALLEQQGAYINASSVNAAG